MAQPPGPSPPTFFPSDPILLQVQWPQPPAAEASKQGTFVKNTDPRGPLSLLAPNLPLQVILTQTTM